MREKYEDDVQIIRLPENHYGSGTLEFFLMVEPLLISSITKED